MGKGSDKLSCILDAHGTTLQSHNLLKWYISQPVKQEKPKKEAVKEKPKAKPTAAQDNKKTDKNMRVSVVFFNKFYFLTTPATDRGVTVTGEGGHESPFLPPP